MSTDSDQVLADRFARLAPKADVDDWADVLRRAGRPGPPRALLVSALLAGALVIAGGALALSGAGTEVPAIDRLLDRAGRDFPQGGPMGAPKPRFQPQPGSVSEKLRFQFRAHKYTAVGFRVADGSVCSALVEPRSKRPNGGIGCIGARSLRRTLAEAPGRLSGGGGSALTITHGFARADVVSLRLTGAGNHGAVALSEPWRPAGEGGEAIRFFYVVTDTAPGPRVPLLPRAWRSRHDSPTGAVTRLPR